MSLAMQIVKARKVDGPFIPSAPPPGGYTKYTGPLMYSNARAAEQGGIFGTIGKMLSGTAGKIVKGIPIVGPVLAGPLESIAGGALDKKKFGVAAASTNFAGISQGRGPGFSGLPQMPSIAPAMTGGTMVGTAIAKRQGTACAPSGYHLNKSGYWSNKSKLLPGASWTEPGTVLVKNRKRNPYNPKAASRAMSRLAALSQGMKVLERQLTKLAPRKRTSCGGRCTSKRK